MSKRGQLENLISLVEKGTTSDPEQSSAKAKEKVKETRKQRRMTSSKRDLDQID